MVRRAIRIDRQFLVSEDGTIRAVVIPIDEYEKFLEEVRDAALGGSSREGSVARSKSKSGTKAKGKNKSKSKKRR